MFEEEEEDSGLSAVRYQVMPSLVSLQLMRNRLHLAYLGRKLMKWSALATGRELRSIAMTLDTVYKSFGEDMQNAYMLLARARYFCPFMNKMVVENIDNKASVTTKSTIRMVTGVKVPQYLILESGVEPYEHLGIEKGGQQIHEAKVAWLDLLKRLILIVELRVSFKLLEISNLSATKRQKVLEKLVAPRTVMTIRYICGELEEKAREDFFRLKKTMQVKRKLASAKIKENNPTQSQTSIELTKTSIPEILETDNNISEEIKEDLLTDTNIQEEVKEDSIKSPKEDSLPSNDVEKFSIKNSEITSKQTYSVESIKSERVIKNLSIRPSTESMNKKVERDNISCLDICDSCRNHIERESSITKENDTDTKTDLELGVWETKYEEIIKIVRVQKEDGTIVEEKKVIKKRKENRIPIDQLQTDEDIDESTLSSKSTHFADSQTIGTVTVKNKSAFSVKRNAISETTMCVPTMTNPIIRFCLSTDCIKSTNNNDFDCVSLFESREDIVSRDESPASSKELELTLNNYTTASANASIIDSHNSSVIHL